MTPLATLNDHVSKIILQYGHHPGKTPEEAAYFYIGEPEEVSPGVHFFTSIGNSTTFVCNDRIMQVDCNGVMRSQAIIDAIRERTDKPFDTLVITHGHLDHCLGTINYIKDNEKRGFSRNGRKTNTTCRPAAAGTVRFARPLPH